MKLGFTGTQIGMSDFQLERLRHFLADARDPNHENIEREFHHGDCIGADEEAHRLAYLAGWSIVIHPPTNTSKRAYCRDLATYLPPKPYLERNHDIVDACDILIVAPKSNNEELRSGTWATYRYAIKKGKPVKMLPREDYDREAAYKRWKGIDNGDES